MEQSIKQIEQTSSDLWSLFHATGKDAVEVNFHNGLNESFYPKGKQIKEYRYGTYGDIVLQTFDDGLTVTIYNPTGKMLVWKDRQKAFAYAKSAKQYCNYMASQL